MNLSKQQEYVVNFPLAPLSVPACAGSGKTATAVRRLAKMRSLLDDRHGTIALLSFSNIAVDTFNRDFRDLVQSNMRIRVGIEIGTVDGFITTNILRPYGALVMGCNRTPFLVDGREPFLKSFTVWDGQRPQPTASLRIGAYGDTFTFEVGHSSKISFSDAEKALTQLGAVGAYTHSSARYWVIRILREYPFVLRALVRRYPHILIDEAQDIGSEHEAILDLMMETGAQVSLIGDTNQGIYEFSGASGCFLADYANRDSVTELNLGTNYRSVPKLVTIANNLSGREDQPDRAEPDQLNGAYYIPYNKADRDKLLGTFDNMLKKSGIASRDAVILCRSSKWAAEWSGGNGSQGQGIVRMFGQAAVFRDSGRFLEAYGAGCIAIVGLLASKHRDLLAQLSRPSTEQEIVKIRRVIWRFLRDPMAGLPAANLLADTEWHPLLVERAKVFVENLTANFHLEAGNNLGNKLAKKKLKSEPLYEVPDLALDDLPRFRVSTVHKVKGESIDGVMYVCNKEHARELLDGTATEVGRIGYVALTRARNLFVVAIPANSLNDLEPKLIAAGFLKATF